MPSIPNPLSKSAAPPAPPPSFWQRSASRLQQHKYLAGGLGLALTAVPAYLVYQRFYAGPPLHRPEDTPRPFSIGSTRSEAVLILGADPGSPGCALARDLTRRGFVVFVTVSEESDVPQLERDVGGWLKAIVLNPTDVRLP